MWLNIVSSATVAESIAKKTHLFNETWKDNLSILPPSLAARIPGAKPDVRPTFYGHWMDLVIRLRKISPSDVHTVVLPRIYAQTLLDASPVAMLSGRLSEMHREDLLNPSPFDHLFPLPGSAGNLPRRYFARLDSASPKDSPFYGTPLTSSEVVVHQLTTSHRAYNGLSDALAESSLPRIYFLPWDDTMDTQREYRVFCAPRSAFHPRPSRVTAVSQYSWHRRSVLADLPHAALEAEVKRLIEAILEIHQEIMAHSVKNGTFGKLNGEGFVFDVYVHPETLEVQLLELNPFGITSLCGSCLFNWVDDAETLYGGKEDVEVRLSI